MKAFLTGSHVYGEPGPDSDIDLVVFTDARTMRKLRKLSGSGRKDAKEEETSGDNDFKSSSVRFGDLNLTILTDEDEYHAWRLATKALEAQKPVHKAYAIERHEWLRKGVK